MKKTLLTKFFAAALAICMTVPMLAQGAAAAERTYLKVSITDGKTVITDTSSSYLTEESPLLVELAQIVMENEDDLKRAFESKAMYSLMNEGIRARKSQQAWDRYLDKMEKDLEDPNGALKVLSNVDCALGDLVLGQVYELAYENNFRGDHGYRTTYTVKLSTHVAGSTRFRDVPDAYWAADSIAYVTDRGLFNGTSADLFSPEAPMTRQMLMTVLARMNGADTSETPYAKGIAWAVANGVSDGSNPGKEISRQQLVAMLYRYLGEPSVTGDLGSFSDAALVSAYAQQPMVWATQNGIVAGKADGRLDPYGLATRAQVATILARFCALNG